MPKSFESRLKEITNHDRRYAVGAYRFLYEGLDYTLKRIGCKRHVSGRELSEGLRDLAIDQFGGLATMVLGQWGVRETGDFGNMVFNLIEADLMSRSDKDDRDDFNGVYDFKESFTIDAEPEGPLPDSEKPEERTDS